MLARTGATYTSRGMSRKEHPWIDAERATPAQEEK
jgi:hypothetical protein